MSRNMRSAAALGAAVVAGLVAAPAAFAGRIDYVVPPSSDGSYTVVAEGHGNGIVKVTYNRCATAGVAEVLPLQVSSRGPVKGSPTADWKVLKDGAADLSFDPAHVTFTGGVQSTHITITPTAASAAGARLRIKLHGANGSGLGEGPGIMVTFACVVAPAPAPVATCPPAATRAAPAVPPGQAKKDDPVVPNDNGNAGQNGNGASAPACPAPGSTTPPAETPAPAAAPAPAPASAPALAPVSLAAPTAATFPVVGSSAGSGPARCVSPPRVVRAVAGEQVTFRVVVRANGVLIRGSAVRVTTPDGTVTKHTDRHGVALFRIRPSRAGRLTIQADACFGVRTVRVKAARVSSRTGVSPAFTG